MTKKKGSIIRLFGTDIAGGRKIKNSLCEMQGMGFTTVKAVLNKAEIDKNKIANDLSDEEIDKIKNVIEKNDLPNEILNRRKDPEDGSNKLMVATDLEIKERQDIDRMKKLGSYRGIRHRQGLPVRGQKTKSSFRGTSSVGVSRERIKSNTESESE